MELTEHECALVLLGLRELRITFISRGFAGGTALSLRHIAATFAVVFVWMTRLVGDVHGETPGGGSGVTGLGQAAM
jgi:hypothetical protein